MMPGRDVDHEIDNRNVSLSRPRTIDPLFLAEVQAEFRADFRAEVRTEIRKEVRAAVREAVRAELQTELQTKQPPMQAGKEEKHMRSKWLELPWRKNPEDPSMSGIDDTEAGDGNSTSNREKENVMSDLSQPMPKPPVRSAREVPTFQVDLSPMEDIYRAIGIMNPPRGYSITKVVEMLNSEHIRDLSKELKRAAVLMALDAAGTSLEQLQRDAKARQDALDAHEAQQRKQVEAEWARKAEEIVQIQAEMDSIKAHYTGRISRNLDGVARQKATFAEWVNSKQQECQGMAEAIELCSKSPVSVVGLGLAQFSVLRCQPDEGECQDGVIAGEMFGENLVDVMVQAGARADNLNPADVTSITAFPGGIPMKYSVRGSWRSDAHRQTGATVMLGM